MGCATLKVATPFAGSGFGNVSRSNPVILYDDPVLGCRTTSVIGADAASPAVLVLQESISPTL